MGMRPSLQSLRVTPEILSLVAEIDEFKGLWQDVGRLPPARLSALRRVATIESVGSSTRIEGSRLSDAEVERLLANLEIRSFASRDEQEVAGYAQVMEMVFAHCEHIDLTENHIRQLHRDLLAHSAKDERHRGSYKTLPNHVSAFDAEGREIGVIFETASPFDTPRRMAEIVAWTREVLEGRAVHPLVAIAVFTVVFLEIHPFQDGNGRLSRILTTLLLLRCGYNYVSYASLENVVEQSKESYYLALRRTQKTIGDPEPDWEPWLAYFLGALGQQKRNLEAKLARERLLADALPELSRRILDVVTAHERATIGELVALTGANRNTIKKHLAALVAARRLERHGVGRGSWYQRA